MSITVKRFRSVKNAFGFLEGLALSQDRILFRGHNTVDYRLQTTLERYWNIQHEEWMHEPENMVDQFMSGLVKAGQPEPDIHSQLERLEFARHHGVPSPLLDFSWSPYVATFFAINGISHDPKKIKRGKSVIYALNVNRLAEVWATKRSQDSVEIAELYHKFQRPDEHIFESGLPENEIRFVPWPGRITQRMHRQQGAFIYSTINYEEYGCRDLEDYFEQLQEIKEFPVLPRTSNTILIKIILHHEWASEIFSRLEPMGILAGYLFASPDGVAQDVQNAFFYNPKTAFLRDRIKSQ